MARALDTDINQTKDGNTVLRNRGTRRALAVAALTATAALTIPGAVTAQQAPPLPVDANFLAVIPALLGAAAESPEAAAQVRDQLIGLLAQPNLPPELQSGAEDIAGFVGSDPTGTPGGPPIPTDGPPIAQFLYPTIGVDCIGPGESAVATALAVAGPAGIPVPGPKAGEAAYVFTALGTGGSTGKLAPEPLTVAWFNVDTMQGGQAPLTADAKINRDGPTTLTAIVPTGSGRVIASINGNIENKSKTGTITCGFAPTVGLVTVP